MSLERRVALLQWARESEALILEDDYDSEFRFSGRPIPALQGLDRHGSVVYMGTFNKVLFTSLRTGYLVVPERLVDSFLAVRFQTDRYPATIPQAILCDFIEEGHFGRHLRRMRELYAGRLNAFETNLNRYLAGVMHTPGIQAGLNTPAYLTNGMTSTQAAKLAADRGIESFALDDFSLQRRDLHGLLLGFAAFEERELRRGILTLAGAFNA
jgi:GntR family transcriptional regulator/MocR family aminotransferase